MAEGAPLFLKVGFIRKVTDQYSLELEKKMASDIINGEDQLGEKNRRASNINTEGDQLGEENRMESISQKPL